MENRIMSIFRTLNLKAGEGVPVNKIQAELMKGNPGFRNDEMVTALDNLKRDGKIEFKNSNFVILT
jgi:hypothetical protein